MQRDPDANPLYQTSLPEARVVADLISTKHDLESAKEYALDSIQPQYEPVRGALFNAAHISYRRAFNRGVDGLGTRDIAALGADAASMHAYHYSQADKLVAHSVNAFEQAKVGVIIKDGEFVGIQIITMRLVNIAPNDVYKFTAHIGDLEVGALKPRLASAMAALEVALQKMPVSQIIRGGTLNLTYPPRDQAGKRR